MEEADRRIEPHPFERGLGVVAEQGVEEREEGVDWIQRRPATSTAKGEGLALLNDQGVEDFEVDPRRLALETAQDVDRGRSDKSGNQRSDPYNRRFERLAPSGLGSVAQRPAEHRARIGDLRRDDPAHDAARRPRLVGRAVLRPTQEDIARNRPFDPREEPPLLGQERHRHPPLAAEAEEIRARAGRAQADDAVEQVDRDPQPYLLLDSHGDRLTVLAQIGARRGDVERVAEAFHGPSPSRGTAAAMPSARSAAS